MTTEKETEIAAEYLRVHLTKPVVLVGMMGVGKTHLGRKLAARLGLEFRDSDKLVEEKAGCSVAQIFKEFHISQRLCCMEASHRYGILLLLNNIDNYRNAISERYGIPA